VPFIIVTALFGIFGFLTSLNNQPGQRKLKDIFHLNHGPSMLATSAWFFAYLVFSVPSGQADREGRLQAHHGHLALHHGGGCATVHSGGQHGELSGLTLDCQLCAGHRRLRLADLGQSLCRDSWSRAQRLRRG
jgi:hypothetical protein